MGKSKIDAKTGIDVAAVNYEVIDRYLGRLGLSLDGGEYAKVVRLHEAMQHKPEKGQMIGTLGNCTTCRGRSYVEMACCPFCGDGAGDETVAEARRQIPDDDPESRVITALRELCTKKIAEHEAKEKNDAPAPPKEGEKQGLVQVLPGQGVRSKRAQRRGGEQLEMPTGDGAADIATERDLDNAISEIKRLLGEAAGTIYDAAVHMFDVHERKLWMQRRGDGGAPKYRNFTEWALAEMPWTPAYCYELCDLPKYFTKEQILNPNLGPTKLSLSLRISEEERKRMLESGDLEKMSVREIKREITQNPASTTQRNSSSAVGGALARLPAASKEKPGKAGAKESPASEEKDEKSAPVERRPLAQPEGITIITCAIPSRVRFPFLRRAKEDGDPPIPATSLANDPTGVITCANGVKLKITILSNADGHLEGIVNLELPPGHRTEDDEDEGEE